MRRVAMGNTVDQAWIVHKFGGSSVADEAWFWLLIGGVVLVGGGLAAYFIADDAAQLRGESNMVVRL